MQRATESHESPATAWFLDQVASAALEDRHGDGHFAMVEGSARGGAMAPLHARDHESETYRVVEGLVTFFVGGEAVSAGPGDVVVAPAGAPRTFRVESSDARWLVLTRVRSLSLFEDFGRATGPALAGDWPSLDELMTLAAIAAANDIVVLGPPGELP
jgi:mannose-6-phosphate isomerase-like protein (cupin superfamily)